MRNRLLVVAAIACLLAVSGADAQKVRVSLRAHPTQIAMDTLGEAQIVKAPMMRVYHAALIAFEGLKIPVEVRDSVLGVVGNVRLTRSSRLGNSSLSRYFDCGSSMTGMRADSYRLTLPVVVILDPAPNDETRVRVATIASAQDVQGNSTEPVLCGSSGRLELAIRKSIADHLKAASQPQ